MSRARLKNRALALSQARQFFQDRDILEVDCGALVKRAPIDANIDVIETTEGFLHTSPEYAMKRLLVQGSGDIFFLGHVYRKGELGRLHNPEFTMAEWYRLGYSLSEMIQETCDFLNLFLGKLPIRILSYRKAFEGINVPHRSDWSESENRHYILSHYIEPNLGKDELTVLTDYPPNEAALACVIEKEGHLVAERFEIYHQGVELANGYHESSNALELKNRFVLENEERKRRNLETYLLDEEFLSAMEKGLPDCCGVSVGFDRTFMLSQKATRLSQILAYSTLTNN
ncbi:MAG TPA: amino acid--tRNA ligase-related protein [Chlamydiales bacterium]|nr:amino acid--tRNA ligase-related protein [Chlamydiales bacterium]